MKRYIRLILSGGKQEGHNLWLPGHCRYAITKSLAHPDNNFNCFQMDGWKISGLLFKRTTACARYVQKLMPLKLAVAPFIGNKAVSCASEKFCATHR